MSTKECICRWSNCAELTARIAALDSCLPADHPWRVGVIEIRANRKSERKTALLKSIFHHLKVPKAQQEGSRVNVAIHHWDPNILRQFNELSKAITKEQALHLDRLHNRAKECQADRCNSYAQLIDQKEDTRYVQAPVFSAGDVKNELEKIQMADSITSSSEQRQSRR